MRNTLLVLSLAAGLGLACASSAGAVPIGVTAMKDAAATTSPLQPAQYAEYRTRRGHLVKCYRELVVGPYYCHWFPL
jgi:hypothetical protein